MGKPLDLSGKVFTRLTAIERVGTTKYRRPLWKCTCSCGNEVICTSGNLVSGNSKSCGCLSPEATRQAKFIHGRDGKDPTYGSWYSMRQRCNNPEHPKYRRYGGRGITICDRWSSFPAFLEDMGERPQGRTLDRINNNGNYEPANCRWATPKEQRNNQG